MALKSADHVSLIIALMSKNSWLADLAWPRVKDTKDVEFVDLPDQATSLGGGMIMIEQGRRDLRELDTPKWPDRESWEADRNGGKAMRPPFAKARFKRRERTKTEEGIRRTFSTPLISLYATTLERDGQIAEVVFNGRFTFEVVSEEEQDIARFGPDDITAVLQGQTAAPKSSTLGYDRVTPTQLEAAILQQSAQAAMDDLDCASAQEVMEEYDPWDLDTAVHVGALLDPQVADDLSHVTFDAENTMLDFDASGVAGINTIGDFCFLGFAAGGDWESPIIGILYLHDGKMRGFIPDQGNHYNRDTMTAWGNGDDDEEAMVEVAETGWNPADLLSSIRQAFGLKANP